ncbi:hypothetical protein [Enterovibrio paralichthyis]|uniref:hypothetical protein n=1 Tax=Enterovibrio paralichthyis TaxID=2853805 RepID=UPI001C4390EC|nr:hypothetical protein [Enterovibrio paralichthyis]MBV7300748.1 hypothetical protein [Enterovibrio paralichthyis]
MQKITFLFFITLLSGCVNAPHENIDTKNSPCACFYNGEQLTTPTNDAQWFEIATEQKGWS